MMSGFYNEKILVNQNNKNQPVDDSGALLNRFLGCVAKILMPFLLAIKVGGRFLKITKKIYIRKPFK